MKESVIKDTTIRINDTGREEIPGKVFECNVNMSVSLSNAKRSKIYQRIQTVLFVFITIIFFIVYVQIKREVQVLEAQMHSMNSNIAFLMIKYDRLSKNIYRINWQQSLLSKSQENPPAINNNNYNNNNNNNNDLLKNDLKKVNISKENVIDRPKDRFSTEKKLNMADEPKKRLTRSLVAQSGYEELNKTDPLRNLMKPYAIDELEDDLTGEIRTGRARRDDGRGPLVATFVGAEPEQHITDTVYVGPWVKRNESRYGFNRFHLVEDQRSIEVTVNGLFMVSVQIVYFGKPTHYSYWILLRSEGTSSSKQVGKCATASANYATEASCFTSVILPLRRGDRLHIQQQERDRLINLREGHSFVQLTLLDNDQQRKRIFT
ncbi:uncharacterized protein [Chelonus insularis]|uniref:uncharacterized protein isoform X2 n=1 Tax=Chelonus insularis TaxID=460826 RepID=UPI00158D2F15|nr:uncharacterized protein LOC118066553 isoform X2 [Chelonus insularis]